MVVLIIGSKGMLGTALTERFSSSHEVIGLDRPDIDITDENTTRQKIESVSPDVLINCAAVNAVDEIETNNDLFELAWKVNAKAVETLGIIAKTLHIPLVHFSSDYVFDGHKKEGYAESSEPQPVSKYGETKFEGERLLQSVTDKYFLVRLSRLFGTAGVGDGVKKSFVDTMLDLAKAGNEVPVIDAEVSSPTYSGDLADFVYTLLESKLPYGIYHAANSGACTWYGWAEEIFKITGMAPQLRRLGPTDLVRPAQRPAYSQLLSTKLPPQRDWQSALRSYLTES